MTWLKRLFVVGVVLLWAQAGLVSASTNKNSTLTQSVDPITCVYTTTATGNSTSSSTACDSYIAATLDTVEPRAGKPLLGGTLAPSDVTAFRVWVGGVWFTNGASPFLTVTSGSWTLDLAGLSTPLAAGEYTIVLEERVLTNFLLRSVYEDVLDIPVVEITRTDTDDGKRVTSSFSSNQQTAATDTLLLQNGGQILHVPSPDAQYLVTGEGAGIYTYDLARRESLHISGKLVFVLLPVLLVIGALIIARTAGFGWLLRR